MNETTQENQRPQNYPFSDSLPSVLERHDQEHIIQSGIDPEVARERGYKSILGKTEFKGLEFSEAQRRVPGLLIPVYSPDGKIAFHQFRPDIPREDAKGKPIKYETPSSVSMRLDVHPRCREGLKNPLQRMFITEGIKKADSLVSRGECVIGLLGVWNFKGKNEFGGTTFLADWDYIALEGRLVYIVFDSDVMTKLHVRQALYRLTEHLRRKGANVYHIYLPSFNGDKVGVDDYLKQGHSISDLIALAREPETLTQPKSKDVAEDVLLGGSCGLADNEMLPQTKFPFDIFPQELRIIIERISDALQVEREVVSGIILCLISGAIGNTIRVSPKFGYEVSPFLWLIIIAHSGYGKSPALNALVKPIKEMQAAAYKVFSEAVREYKRIIRAARQLDSSIEIPEEPKLEHYIFSDTTVEALGKGFESTPRGIIVYQDELAGLILGLNQYKGKGTGNDRQHYLELFDGQSWKIDRKSETRFIPNTGAAILGGIQPTVMPRVFSTESFDDGLLPRFLFIGAEDKPLKFSRKGIDEDDLSCWNNLLRWCYKISLVQDDNGFVMPKIIILKEEGLTIWEEFFNEYGGIIPFLSDRAKVFIPKLLTYGLKFMASLHILNTFSSGKILDGVKEVKEVKVVLDEETVTSAIKLTRFFTGQVVNVLDLYKPKESKLSEFAQRLVKTLYMLKQEVTNGQLPLYRINEVFNTQLPINLRHTPEKVSSLLRRGLGLRTTQGTGNYTVLLWEKVKIEELFSKITLTTLTSLTANPMESEEFNIPEIIC